MGKVDGGRRPGIHEWGGGRGGIHWILGVGNQRTALESNPANWLTIAISLTAVVPRATKNYNDTFFFLRKNNNDTLDTLDPTNSKGLRAP
jgi:hypothetical protein